MNICYNCNIQEGTLWLDKIPVCVDCEHKIVWARKRGYSLNLEGSGVRINRPTRKSFDQLCESVASEIWGEIQQLRSEEGSIPTVWRDCITTRGDWILVYKYFPKTPIPSSASMRFQEIEMLCSTMLEF